MNQQIIAEVVTISGDGGDRIPAYLARPLAIGPYGSVMVLHHRDGWDGGSKEITRRLAAEGFVALMPHLHHRNGPGLEPELAAARAQESGGIADSQVLGDTLGAKAHIVDQPFANGKVGMIGYCSGGRQAFMVACHEPFDATVTCYGGRIVAGPDELHEKMPVAAIDMTPGLQGPVLGLFGAHDTKPSPEHVAHLTAELEKHGKDYRFVTYENAGHAFFAVDRPSYNPEAATKGWAEVLSFFHQHLDG